LLEYPDQCQLLAGWLAPVLQHQTVEMVAPRINPRQRLPAALIAKLGRLRPDHLAHDPSRHPKLAANRLDRLPLNEKRATDLRDRLHYQHPLPGSHVPHGSHCGPTVPGVPIECRSPRKRGPYSMPIHIGFNPRISAINATAVQSLDVRLVACKCLAAF